MNDPVICPENGVPALASYARYHCRCSVCVSVGEDYYGASSSDPDPEAIAEAEAKQAEAERQAEEVRDAMVSSYNSGGRSVDGGHVPSAAVEDVSDMIED